jgi:polysaccharide biosynthesis transport protein
MPQNFLLPGEDHPLPTERRLFHNHESYKPAFNISGAARALDQDAGSILEYWRILNKRKGTLLLIAAASLLAGFLSTKLQAPMYRAKTLVEIESITEDFLNVRDANSAAQEASSQSPETNVRTQIAVLQSRPVIERTLRKQNLWNRMIADRRKSHGLLSRPVKASVPDSVLRAEAVMLASNSLRIRNQPNTRVLEITFDAKDPHIATDFVNSLSSAFTEVTFENRLKFTQDTSVWLTRHIQDVKVQLRKAEDELQKYAHASNLTFTSETDADTTVQARMKEMQMELSRAEEDRILKQSRYEMALQAPADSLPEILDNTTLRDFHIQLSQLRQQFADLSSRFTPDYPKVVSTQAQIKAVQAALEREKANIVGRTRNEFESAVRRESLLNTKNRDLNALMSTQADKLSHYQLLKQEVATSHKLYDVLTQRVKEADLDSAMRASNIHVIEAAQSPVRPYKPVVALNMAFGLVSGLGLGCLVLIQWARNNTRIQEPGDTPFELHVPELGIIPSGRIEAHSKLRLLLRKNSDGQDEGTPELSTLENSSSVLAESFRLTLASILLCSSQDARPTVLALSSAHAGEGKTTVVTNLAIAMSRMNRRVLLIDGDLRKRRLHRIFKVDNNNGLKEALLAASVPGLSPTSIPSQAVEIPHIPNLCLLPSGKGETGEMLFFTAELRGFLQRLKTQFDMIDTPPLLQVADARLICHEADACILVVAQHTAREMVLLARQKLADDGSRLLGTILNNYDPKTTLHGYKNYGNYYRDYYGKSREFEND